MKIEFYDKETGKAVQGWYVADEMGDVLKLHYGAWNGISAEIADGIGWRIIDQWQPIETAPKDGTEMLVLCNGKMFVASWCNFFDCFAMAYDGHPLRNFTHWMPLPTNPQSYESNPQS